MRISQFLGLQNSDNDPTVLYDAYHIDHMIWNVVCCKLLFIYEPNDGTILRNKKIESIVSGTQVNFDIGMQPYTVTQYGQSSTDFFRLTLNN